MIKKLLTYFAKRSHDVRIQVALASVYGLISIFGVGKTLLIMNQLRKQAKKGARNGRKTL